MYQLKKLLASITPASIFAFYHLFLAWFGAVLYGFPARKMIVIGVTGTKGKSSVTEMVSLILEEAGHKTALINSIRFKLDDASDRNRTRMSMLGRFFIQRFLSLALKKGCTAAVIEMTSEGARQSRHRFIDLDALIFTNLAPEHIESHGSLEAYANAKFEIGKELVRSKKRPRIMVANADDKASGRYITLPVEQVLAFSLSNVSPFYADENGGFFTLENQKISIHIPGEFSLKNALAATLVTRALGVPVPRIVTALDKLLAIPGRAEKIEAGQNFTVVVDYAHTPDSLTALYEAFSRPSQSNTPNTANETPSSRNLICVLSATGGGRDTWKRPVMGRIADSFCKTVILTNEDPYDENPEQIMQDVAHGMTHPPRVIMDRREAIRAALDIAQSGDAVLITGKGTDPDIRGPHGTKTPWSDAKVVREELELLKKSGA